MKWPKNKVEHLRLSSKVVWCIGSLLTFNFAREVSQPESFLPYLITIGVSCGMQYIFTLSISALISGTLPLPWKENWNPRLTSIWFGGIVCLLLDILLNIGGGQYIIQGFEKSSTNAVLGNQFGADSGLISFITGAVIIILGTFFALGSEILNAQADYLEGKIVPLEEKSHLTMTEHRGKMETSREPSRKPLVPQQRKGTNNNG